MVPRSLNSVLKLVLVPAKKPSRKLVPRPNSSLSLSPTLIPRKYKPYCFPMKLPRSQRRADSTGVLSDIKAVAETVKSVSPNTLVVVDGVCSVGSEEIRFDAWNLDIVITGSQKGLGVPPGLSIVVASQKALQVVQERKTPVPSYYSNWNKWLPVMQAYEARKPSYFATPAVQLIYALHASLTKVLSQPLEVRFEKHRQVASQFRQTVKNWGLKQVAQCEECSANGMTAIWLPEGVQVGALVGGLAGKGVQIAGGILKDRATEYFRIGHMGISVMEDERQHIKKVESALANSLNELGYKGASD